MKIRRFYIFFLLYISMIRRSFRKNVKPEKIIYAIRMRELPTHAEKILWDILKNRNLGVKFRRQAIIYGYIVDFYSPEIELVIEVDGDYHKTQIIKDKRREDKIKTIGVEILRFSNEEVINNKEKVISILIDYIHSKR